ncbi:hypothetical protein BH18THE1_BH18THE1_04390 [soil metagenome]
MVPLAVSLTVGPNVSPLSVLALNTGCLTSSVPFMVSSHQVTYTLFPSAAISASTERSVELLRLIFSPNNQVLYNVCWLIAN